VKHQRDINSLSDPDRAIRIRGINNLVNELYNNKKKSQQETTILIKIFECQISRFIKELLADPVEKIREKTLKMIEVYVYLLSEDIK
jgi:hypothetical protein